MLISVGFNAYVCRGEANSVIVDFVEQIKTDNPTAIALVCSSDSAIAIATMKMVVMETLATMAGMNTLQGRVLMPPTLSFAKGNMLRVANGLWPIDETRYAFVKYYSHLVG
jgi:hypothetical protein